MQLTKIKHYVKGTTQTYYFINRKRVSLRTFQDTGVKLYLTHSSYLSSSKNFKNGTKETRFYS